MRSSGNFFKDFLVNFRRNFLRLFLRSSRRQWLERHFARKSWCGARVSSLSIFFYHIYKINLERFRLFFTLFHDDHMCLCLSASFCFEMELPDRTFRARDTFVHMFWYQNNILPTFVPEGVNNSCLNLVKQSLDLNHIFVLESGQTVPSGDWIWIFSLSLSCWAHFPCSDLLFFKKKPPSSSFLGWRPLFLELVFPNYY